MPKRCSSITIPNTTIFLHIPKTGGSTLRSIIHRQYADDKIFTIKPLYDKSIRKFKTLPDICKKEYAVVQGYMGFGLNNDIPQRCAYITILRDPIERVLSNYYYGLGKNHPDFYRENQAITLDEFVNSGMRLLVNNGATRLLSSREGRIWKKQVGYGACTDDMLERDRKSVV